LRGEGARGAALVATGAAPVVAVGLVLHLDRAASQLWVVGGCLALLCTLLLVYVRPALHVRRWGLDVRGSLRAVRVPWAEVDGFEARMLLLVRRTSGRRVPVVVVGTRGRERMRGRITYPQVVAAALEERLRRVRTWGVPPPAPHPAPPSRRADLILLGVGAVLGVVALRLLGLG
jgi:hypothetical protein